MAQHTMKDLSKEIVREAEQYLGIRELKNNSGWRDKEFQSKMEAIGWRKGQPWCAYFVKMIWAHVYGRYEEGLEREVREMLSGHVMTNVRNAGKNPLFRCDLEPSVGSIILWRVGSGTSGHTGIIKDVRVDKSIVTIEGNTNVIGERDGEVVAIKERRLNFGSFRCKGIIHPRAVMVYENATTNLFESPVQS